MPVPLRTTIQKAEAKYNVTTEFTNYNLHAGAANGDIGLVEFALHRRQPINSVLDGVQPLHAAAAGGNEQVVRLLIDYGADVNAPRLPRRYSNEKGRDASAPIVGDTGATPLHFASANGNTEIVRILLQRGAHPDLADKHGVTPEQLARRQGWLECADLLRDWAQNKDRDLREREGRISGYQPSADEAVVGRVDPHEASTSGRKRLHVKKSIDTAFHMLKGSASDAHLRLHTLKSSSSKPNIRVGSTFHTPPASPTRSFGEYTFYPITPADDGIDPADPSKRRPSLPHVLNPLSSGNRELHKVDHILLSAQHTLSAASLTSFKSLPRQSTASPSPRRPGSAGSDADRVDSANSPPPACRRLGSKYSLMNLFKKGQYQSSEVPSDSSSTHRPSLSSSVAPSSVSTYSSLFNPSLSPTSHHQHLPTISNDTSSSSLINKSPGFRTGSSSPSSNSIPIATRNRKISSTQSQSPPHQGLHQVYRHHGPSAVELHHAMAQQHYASQQSLSTSPRRQHLEHLRNRSASVRSGAPELSPPLLSDDDISPSPDDFSLPSSPQVADILSSSPPADMPRMGVLRAGTASPRDRSGSGSSISRSRNRSGAVFDDDVTVPAIESMYSRAPVRPPGPGILRGHNRTSSGTSGVGSGRSLRFDSVGATRRPDNIPVVSAVDSTLRGSTSTSSLSRVVAPTQTEQSAPIAVSSFPIAPNVEQEELEDDYGEVLAEPSLPKPLLDLEVVESAVPSRLRGLSFTSSSDGSYSPVDGDMGQEQLLTGEDHGTHTQFPFSLNQPPLLPLIDASEGRTPPPADDPTDLRRLRVPSGDDDEGNRTRGDSVSSASTGVSSQGALPAISSSTTNALEGTLNEPVVYVEEVDGLEPTVKIAVNVPPAEKDTPGANGFGHRRTRTPMDINISSISTHAQAEALVQKAQRDILEMENEILESGGLSTSSTGYTPLSAKLAKYGESLALERKLREQKQKEEQMKEATSAPSTGSSQSSPPSSTYTSQDVLNEPTRSAPVNVHRQYSLEHRPRRQGSRVTQKQPRRPHTSSGTPETARNLFTTKTHQSSQSASIIDIRPRALSIDAELDSPTTPHPRQPPGSSSDDLQPTVEGSQPKSAPYTPSPMLYSEDLSRTSSLEVNDTDGDCPSTSSIGFTPRTRRDQPRDIARATKLTKMGFTAPHPQPPVPPTKRFGGIKSLIQGLKGK
ncbi:hypothetical protein PC9H_007734 [Pleurotus ostreatus]|uniref:Ankyrin n=1 Tax=Pleurotus ostreatus TaxID=5322 RepID=A0A8H7DT15_PLEOS|nr:uncharacterized protein PC9H_007734 [Pleurotus ostreatus]KAF7428510.1 hypothetical protein PC9H_007734 [Pleurotus ostreatus]